MKSILKSLYQNSRNKEIKELIFKVFNEDFVARAEAAANSNTPVSILEYLSKDKISSYVRIRVALNSNTPIPTLKKLSNDKDEYVREYVVENPNWKQI